MALCMTMISKKMSKKLFHFLMFICIPNNKVWHQTKANWLIHLVNNLKNTLKTLKILLLKVFQNFWLRGVISSRLIMFKCTSNNKGWHQTKGNKLIRLVNNLKTLKRHLKYYSPVYSIYHLALSCKYVFSITKCGIKRKEIH